MKYRKKPVVIEAFQIGSGRFYPDWLHDAITANIVITHGKPNGNMWKEPINSAEIHTLEGIMNANHGDWIIQGVRGELYPCKPDIFAATYEAADWQAQQDADKVDAQPVAWFAFTDNNGPIPMELYGWDEKACKHAVLTYARANNWKGTIEGYLLQNGWTLRPVYLSVPVAASSDPAMTGNHDSQIQAALSTIRQDYGPDSIQSASPRDYVENAVMQLIDAGYRRVQAVSGEDARDAALLRAMAAEWDRARRGVDSHMPIWDALCEAIGNNADGNGMRAAIDATKQPGGQP